MKCSNCNFEYEDNLLSCPKCGAVNKKAYNDIKEVELKLNVFDKFLKDLKTKKFQLKKELPLLIISILIILIATILCSYYFTYIEENSFLYKILVNYAFWLIILAPISIYLYYKELSLLSFFFNLYFAAFTLISIFFPFFLEMKEIYIYILLGILIIFLIVSIFKIGITKIKSTLLNHHIISYLVFILSTMYLLITMLIILIRIICY